MHKIVLFLLLILLSGCNKPNSVLSILNVNSDNLPQMQIEFSLQNPKSIIGIGDLTLTVNDFNVSPQALEQTSGSDTVHNYKLTFTEPETKHTNEKLNIILKYKDELTSSINYEMPLIGQIAIDSIDSTNYPDISLNFTSIDMDNKTIGISDINASQDDKPVKINQLNQTDKNKYTIEITVPYEETESTKVVTLNYNSNIVAKKEYEIINNRQDAFIEVKQVDTSNYPEVKVYLTLKDNNDSVFSIDQAKYIKLTEESSGNITECSVKSVAEVKKESPINISLVLDASGSMDGNNFYIAQQSAGYFLGLLDYDKGDQASVMSFTDTANVAHFFSNNKESLLGSIYNLYTDGATALYDALYASLMEISVTQGSKCIVAFTDGMDNSSFITPDIVINTAKQLGVPIYIIGLGAEDYKDLVQISTLTGGYFTTVTDISELNGIFEKIFREQEEQTVVTYNATLPKNNGDARLLTVNMRTKDYQAKQSFNYNFTNIVNPNVDSKTIAVNLSSMTEIEKAIYDYEHSFVDAVNSYNFNVLSPYLDPNGSLYKTQENLLQSYQKRGIQERLLYYKINSIDQTAEGDYLINVNEQFYIQIGYESASYKEFENEYLVKNTANGYKVSEMPSLKTISKNDVEVGLY